MHRPLGSEEPRHRSRPSLPTANPPAARPLGDGLHTAGTPRSTEARGYRDARPPPRPTDRGTRYRSRNPFSVLATDRDTGRPSAGVVAEARTNAGYPQVPRAV